ncbi:MAG: DNA polymerase III subunit beta [Propionibacteriaceae bacterium]|nr:DNA polymerase III subunit beta [Propionibacteriaceae bacterium]
MKFVIERDVLAEAVAWVARSLPTRPSVPILSGIKISVTKDQVVFESFDYETSARVVVPAAVERQGETLVSGKLLAEIARSLPKMKVEFTVGENAAELVCGKASFTLQTMPTDEYPALPQLPEAAGTVTAEEFASALTQVVVAAGRDELLPIFTGVRMEISSEQMALLATDRYRMALRELPWNANVREEVAALVPAKTLLDAAKSLSASDLLTISLAAEAMGDGIIGLHGKRGEDATFEVTTRLLDGDFPKLRHLMEITPLVTVRANTAELMAAVKRVGLVAERNTSMRMLIDFGAITLEAATGDTAYAIETLEAVVEDKVGDGLSIVQAGFNPAYLHDALSVVETPYVNFSFTQPGKPCVITQIEEIDGEEVPGYRHVIMLMRLPVQPE